MSAATPVAIIVLAVLMFFRDRIIQRPTATAEQQLTTTYKNLLEAQLIEIGALKGRIDKLERRAIAVEVIAEVLAHHAPELADRLTERMKGDPD